MDPEQESIQEQKDAQSGFASGFTGEALKEPEKAPELANQETQEQPKDGATDPEKTEPTSLALTAEEIAAFRTSTATVAELQGRLRSAQGQIGALTGRLNEFAKQKKEDGKPPAMTALELKQTMAAYPELAAVITADLGETLAKLQPKTDPEEVTRLVDEKVAERLAEKQVPLLRSIVRSHHRDFDAVIAAPDFKEWVTSLPQAERDVIETSANPDEIVSSLDTFKAWRSAKTKAKDESQERLKQAITPTGEKRPASKSNLDPIAAMRKGYEEGFAS